MQQPSKTLARLVLNPQAQRTEYTPEEARVVSVAGSRRALEEMSGWSCYRRSPLRSLPQLARQLGIGSLAVKDESDRFGLGSFKALGGAYAAGLALRRRSMQCDAGSRALPRQAGSWIEPIVLCCATDGNHGRSVAFGAQRYGCQCVVFMHEAAPESKAQAILRLGGRVIRTSGSYDDSVRHAERVAGERGWMLISDTSDLPDDVVAADVMQGYGVMALELEEQLEDVWPSHVFLQGGVGGLAAAVSGCFAEMRPEARPLTVVVEPDAAACLMECVVHGAPRPVSGDLVTNMAMLSCGVASAPAWVVLKRRADAFLAISDELAARAAERLGRSRDVPEGLAASPSAAAGLGGLAAALADREFAERLLLTTASRVLIFATEGAENA